MKKIEITEMEAKKIEATLKNLENEIEKARVEHGEVLNDRRDSFRNSMSFLISQDMERLVNRARTLKTKLEQATIIKTDMNSDETTVDIGDVVETQITYEGKETMHLKFQIDGDILVSDAIKVTLLSPIGTSLRGKKVGENFVLEKSSSCPTNAKGTILGLVKAKDLKSNLEEADKKIYTLKHS